MSALEHDVPLDNDLEIHGVYVISSVVDEGVVVLTSLSHAKGRFSFVESH